jgi:hypothetical protein
MWKLGAGLASVALIAFALWLGITRYGAAQFQAGRNGALAEVAVADQANTARWSATIRASEQAAFAKGQEARLGFIRWREGPLRMITQRIENERIVYRTSPAGRALCFDADSVRATNADIDAINATAFTSDPSATTRSDGAMQPSPVARNGKRRDGNPLPSPRSDDESGAILGRMREETPIADARLAEVRDAQ